MCVSATPGGWELEPGDFIRVRITGATAHDLQAEPLEAEETE